MKKIYILFSLAIAIGAFCTSCNDEWTEEQFRQEVSFKAEPNGNGVKFAYLRYRPDGTVRYELPIILSGSTMNPDTKTVHVTLDPDTLAVLNNEQYGGRKEIYFQQLDPQYYSFPETVEIPAGECTAVLPIDFTLGGREGNNPLDESEKWVLPLTIVDDDSYDYKANPRKHYRKAILRISPFNDYSGSYAANRYQIAMEGVSSTFQMDRVRSFVMDDQTIFIYAGTRDIDYLDRKNYKVFIKFTDEIIDHVFGKKKIEMWSDNTENNKFKVITSNELPVPYYTMTEEFDVQKPYLKRVYIDIHLAYEFVDYTTLPGSEMKYTVNGSLSMERELNTLIPDEDQQIQW
ncbi:DUF4973 domain-containing protein [Bacteroides caecimuris]|uniref:DUF4973 domain-containing protein n=1 Tax=Bacteroides caecimuris TaxID=1796613 RepID=UPI000EA37177|nr:DUF4973 domain-containing protein [Bacteroides caecimuris]